MNEDTGLPRVRVTVCTGKVFRIRNPDVPKDVQVIVAPHDEAICLEGIEKDVRGRLWILFPVYRHLGLPVRDGYPNIKSAWDDLVLEVQRINPADEEEYFT